MEMMMLLVSFYVDVALQFYGLCAQLPRVCFTGAMLVIFLNLINLALYLMGRTCGFLSSRCGQGRHIALVGLSTVLKGLSTSLLGLAELFWSSVLVFHKSFEMLAGWINGGWEKVLKLTEDSHIHPMTAFLAGSSGFQSGLSQIVGGVELMFDSWMVILVASLAFLYFSLLLMGHDEELLELSGRMSSQLPCLFGENCTAPSMLGNNNVTITGAF